MILDDMVYAFIGLVALRAVFDLPPGTPAHTAACEVYDAWAKWSGFTTYEHLT